MKELKIGFIGNFVPSFSTEQDRKWSFEKLGHKVIPFQENNTSKEDLINAMGDLDMLMYSHTHGWEIKDLREVFEIYKSNHIPTVSAHLDRWAWLDRVKDVGNEATWFTEYIFMADASPEAVELYDKLKLNWHYLKPAVIERDCYLAETNRVKFPHRVVFTGSKNYHKEYTYRPKLVEWLKQTYKEDFGHYGNDGICVLREDLLNQLYSTADVVVGDSCFGGRPNYVSDRYFEVRGRGGLLIHPKVEGVDDFGVIHYEHGNFSDLKNKIDWVLNNPVDAMRMRKFGFEHVRDNETYTHRAEEILNIVFKNKND